MKIKKNIAISLIKDLIQDDKFKKEIIDLISSTSDSSGVAKLEEKKIFNNLLKVHKKPWMMSWFLGVRLFLLMKK